MPTRGAQQYRVCSRTFLPQCWALNPETQATDLIIVRSSLIHLTQSTTLPPPCPQPLTLTPQPSSLHPQSSWITSHTSSTSRAPSRVPNALGHSVKSLFSLLALLLSPSPLSFTLFLPTRLIQLQGLSLSHRALHMPHSTLPGLPSGLFPWATVLPSQSAPYQLPVRMPREALSLLNGPCPAGLLLGQMCTPSWHCSTPPALTSLKARTSPWT